jgi:hypothetical protein
MIIFAISNIRAKIPPGILKTLRSCFNANVITGESGESLLPKLVSVVVPAYNAANRIGSALKSIMAQDHAPIEIVVVDDASSDCTADMASGILGGGRQFKILRHGKNMGVSAARNTGMKAAEGDYVIFFDADDEADLDFVSVLYETITKNDCDIAFCGYRNRFEPTGEERAIAVRLDPSRRYTGEEITSMRIFKQIETAIWSTIFRRGFLDETGIEFAVGCQFGEDVEFLVKAFSLVSFVDFSTRCPYIYVHHDGMASKASDGTEENALLRYAGNAEAIVRTARYLKEHSPSQKVRDIADSLLLPEGLIKMLNVAARQNDVARFFQTLNAPETRRALMSSRKHLARKPEVFAKAAFLMIAPHIYFRRQSRP